MTQPSAAESGVLEREIRAQPALLERFRADQAPASLALGARLAGRRPAGVLIAARGSSDHAAVYAKYLFGLRLGVPVALAAPSLFSVYHSPPRLEGWVVLGISQSGASPDVVAVVGEAREQGCETVALCDVADSDLARTAQHLIPLGVGGERSVAATGSFTTTLYALAHLASGWSGTPAEEALARVAENLASALGREREAQRVAHRLVDTDVCIVLGRGYGFPVALECSLKLKEIAGLFAEPFSSADYRHGPIALASSGLPALLIDLNGPTRGDIDALLAELRRRGAEPLRLSDQRGAELPLPSGPEWLAPIPATGLTQLLALHTAVARGHDPDRPSGLSKITRTL